jgi:hypothetical protein
VKVGDREVKIYAVSVSALKQYIERGARHFTHGGDCDFIYLGTRDKEAFHWRQRLAISHKSVSLADALFRRTLLNRLFSEYKKILEVQGLKRYFVVCDEEGAAAKRCVRFAVADFLISMFQGQNLSDTEREVIDLLLMRAQEFYGIHLEKRMYGVAMNTASFHIVIDGLDTCFAPEKGSIPLAVGIYAFRRLKPQKESGILEERRTPLFMLFADLKTGVRCIYPRVPLQVWEELGAELVVNA